MRPLPVMIAIIIGQSAWDTLIKVFHNQSLPGL